MKPMEANVNRIVNCRQIKILITPVVRISEVGTTLARRVVKLCMAVYLYAEILAVRHH
jgi:hypothetical protein